jgi:ABC-type phosphate transport system substrate-binding protein
MQNRTKAAIGGALALSITLGLGGQALADPPTGVTPKATDIVGVGSDATQYVVDALAKAYDAGTTHPIKLYSWDAVGSSPIVTKAGKAPITRPAGGNAGVAALLADTTGAIDFARTTAPKKTDGSQNSLTFYSFARDGVTWAAVKSTKTPTNLTSAQLKSIFTCQTTNWNQVSATLPSGTIHPFLPASTFALRTFFEGAIGITDAQVGACVGTLAEQSNGKLLNNDPLAIAPYSISNYLAQKKAVVPNNIGGTTLRSIDSTAPTVTVKKVVQINPAFSPTYLRLVYNVVKTASLATNPNLTKIFAKGGFFCTHTAIIKKYGFGTLGAGACGIAS